MLSSVTPSPKSLADGPLNNAADVSATTSTDASIPIPPSRILFNFSECRDAEV